jgi:hypothetical protein
MLGMYNHMQHGICLPLVLYRKRYSIRLEACMWHLWRLRPQPLWPPWRWPWRYYAWRLETYTGIPAAEVTWHTFRTFFRQPEHRRALWRYVRWLKQMRRLRHLGRR